MKQATKKTLLMLILSVLALITADALIFVLSEYAVEYNWPVFQPEHAFWGGMFFMNIAIIASIAFYILRQNPFRSPKGLAYSIAEMRRCRTFCVVQCGVALVFMAFYEFHLLLSIFIQALFMVFFVVRIIRLIMVRSDIERLDRTVEKKTCFIETISADLQDLYDRANSAELRNNLRNACETARYSDPLSVSAVSGIERKIDTCLTKLTKAVNSHDETKAQELSTEMVALLNNRNRYIRINKN